MVAGGARGGGVNKVLRKCGHALAYAVFGVLVWRAAPGGGRPIRRPLVSLGFAVALAMADETLQGLSPARDGSFYDVVLDAGGAMLGIALVVRREDAPGRGRAAGDVERRRRTPTA